MTAPFAKGPRRRAGRVAIGALAATVAALAPFVEALAAEPAMEPAVEAACASFAWPILDAKAALAGSVPIVASGGRAAPAFTLALRPMDDVAFPVKPERMPKAGGTFGGYVTFDPPAGRLLQVTLSGEAWIDVVRGQTPTKSTAFSGKSGCAGVRKSVRFEMSGVGPLTLQVSGVATPAIQIDIRGVP